MHYGKTGKKTFAGAIATGTAKFAQGSSKMTANAASKVIGSKRRY